MRKLKLFLSMLMLIAFSVGNVWAVDYDLVYTLDGSVTSTASGSSAYATAIDIDVNDITWNVMGNTTLNPWGIGGKNLSSTSRSLFSKGSIDANIVKIDIEHGAASSVTVNAMTVEVATDVDFTDIVSTCTPTFAANSTITVNHPDGDEDWSNCYYRITYSLTIGSSNKKVEFKSAKFYKEKSADAAVLESITINGDLSDKSYEEGESIDFSGLTATGHYSDESSDDLTNEVEWSFSPALTAGLTSVTVTATLDEISGNKDINGLTVAEHTVTPGTYDIPTDNDLWGTSYSGQATSITTLSGSKNDVSITINKNTGSTMYVTSSQTRIYSGYTMIFSVPNGYAITALQFTADGSNWQGNHTADVGTMTDNKNWSGEANSVIITVAGTCRMKAVKVTYAVAAPSKAEAGLAYAEADLKKLAKLGDAFTAPTLQNPNSLTVSYASNNTDVAEVAANGAVTIKAAGVAVITASFDGNDDYKAGSASYTIGVTTHAGTEADPYVAADAKIAIDAMGTVENAYATGIVSNVVTTTLPQEGYITFYFSADGATTGQQIEAYKCYGLNSAAFEALSDVETGATVVVTGNLKKYNSTYEFDANCHLVSYEAPAVPKTHIANDQANPYTVAQAIAYAADGVTYDLDDYVYVQGVVYDVKSFNNGAMNIFIKDANAENQFELFKCAGINDGNATTPFEALTDVQAGNIVIGYGQLTVFNSMSELKQGNYLVDLQKPATGIELDATAEVEAGLTVNLTATILPSNATGTIVWSVESGDDYASVENGVVTGIAEGEAVIRATVQGTAFYAECTVTVTPEAAPVSYDYALVTDVAQLHDGLKVIIVAANEDKAAGSAAATYRNVVDVERTTDGNYLILDGENMPTEFTIGVSGNNFTFNDGDGYMYESAVKSVKVREEAFEWTISIGDGNIATISAPNGDLKYNSGSPRFTTYASGQQALQLYVKNDGKQAAGLAWSANAVELTVGDEFEAPTLTNPNNLVVTITSDNEEVATVSEGIVSLVTDATGTAKITASYAGDETYRAASVSYTITVNPASVPAETKNIVILAEYNSKFYAMTNSLGNGALAGVEVEKDGDKIVVSSEADKAAIQWTATIVGENTTLMDADNKYITGLNSASLSLEEVAYNWNWDSDKSCYISSSYITRGLFFNSANNVFKGYATTNLTNNGYAATEVIEIAAENIVVTTKVDPQLAFDPAEVMLTVGDAFVAPVLGYVEGFDGLADVTLESSNTNLAVVNEGVVSLVEDAIGTATITATFAGNSNYLPGSASYTITVNKAAATPTSTVYRKVTATADITDGEYLIVYETTSVAFNGALETLDAEGNSITVTINEDEIAGNTEIDAATFTIDVTAGTLQSASGKYIGVSSNSNGLKQTDESTTYTHTFSIDDDGNAVIAAAFEGSTMTLRYNAATSAGNLRFRYYKNNGQQAIQLYKKVVVTPDPVDPVYTEVRTGLNNGQFYTMCLENNVTAVDGASIWQIIGKSGNSIELGEVSGELEAGKPYFFKAEAATLKVVYGDEFTTIAGTNNGLVGSFTEENITAGESNYILYDNKLYEVAAGQSAKVGANRAYVDFDAIGAVVGQSPAMRRMAMPIVRSTATGIEAIEVGAELKKVVIDGQLYIVRDGRMYDVTGQLVR